MPCHIDIVMQQVRPCLALTDVYVIADVDARSVAANFVAADARAASALAGTLTQPTFLLDNSCSW